MKVMLNPHSDSFMFIDKEAGIYLSLSTPVCTFDESKITEGVKRALKVETLIDITEKETVPPEELPEEAKVATQKKATTKKKTSKE